MIVLLNKLINLFIQYFNSITRKFKIYGKIVHLSMTTLKQTQIADLAGLNSQQIWQITKFAIKMLPIF